MPKATTTRGRTTASPGPTPAPTIIVFESPRLYLTVDEAARYLRVSRRTVYTLMKRKQISFSRVREGVRFRLQWLNDYLDKRTVKAA